ncbi:MAG TPA: response regulator transcription factor [Prolixibacteraceae bacterium]|nr:response regulator transcription factor [Bacteroidales bacterium]HNZ71796.1 response regulator transcription factor [Prolixibacteraceae bacterium]HPB05022.1 response regulator transcription factor [Prolixibacteraceae bacterium]HQN93385.1 response regulator transcription factor [Prolixibacteraceae bacterium]
MIEDDIKILVVDDEKDLCEILQFNLESEGYEVDTANSAEEALKKNLHEYDLILLDVMMGGMSGFKAADTMRKQKQIEIPIIFITAKSSENDLLTGFNVGGDDYIQKPFSVKEVIARVKAVLKRGKHTSTEKISCDTLEIDLSRKLAYIDGRIIDLTRKEFDILLLLMKKKGSYVSREEILDRVWDDDVVVTERNVDVNIARLRKKIGEYGNHIKGKTGYGYLFEE